jgi:hypothetical protein
MMSNLIGTNPEQVPVNGMLGKLAFMDSDAPHSGALKTLQQAPTLASAATIIPTTLVTFISGTTSIVNITVPEALIKTGGEIRLIPTGLWATTSAGNIALATTAIVGKLLVLVYDAGTSKWYPSY